MRIRFFWVATLWAVWLWLVAITWVVNPSLPLALWEMPMDDAAISLGLRVAALCVGWGLILFMARREPPSGARRAISYGSAAGNVAAAVGGIYSLASGLASAWILQAVVLELITAAAFVLAERAPRPVEAMQAPPAAG
jgi:4-amino-4-deoxy-L-arabinose transferase-like glycosyltransferase